MLFHTLLFVFIAEMADKTQLMIMALTNRYRIKTVLAGMILGVFLISGISVLAGDLIGDFIPIKLIKSIAAFMFLVFGFSNLKASKKAEKGKQLTMHFPILSIAISFIVAELGDKTQLATVALAADHMGEHLLIFLGASFGLIMANMLGILTGKFIFSRLHEDTMKVASSFCFFFFGSITLFEAIPVSNFFIILYSTIVMTIAYLIFAFSRRQKVL